MSGKTPTPSLKHLAKEADTLKKKLDKLQKECATVFNNPSASNRQDKLKRFYQDCVDMRNDMTDLNNRITKMTKADEPTKMSNFDSKKDDEVKRLTKMLDQVKEMEKKLEPDETEEDYYRKIKEELNSEEDGVDEDEEYEEEGEEEGEEEYTDEEGSYEEEDSEYEEEEVEEECEEEENGEDDSDIKVEPEYELLYDFVAQKKGDLEVKAGEIVILRSVRDDSWWVCENQNGETGLVPSNFLKPHVKYSDLMTEDDPQTPISPRTGKELWGSIKKALSETSATDVLHAFGAVPPGFRLPTSARLHSLNEKHTLLNYGAVKLSNSNLFYKDLFYNPATSKVRPRTARIQKVVTLLEAKNIPLPGEKVVVHSRLARLSLFDGSKFLSNIVTTLAHVTDKEGRNWRFLVKPTTLESSECFVRVAEPSNQIGILIELSVVFSKEGDPEKVSELSCGWAFKPMFEENGTLILNKEYDLMVNGGTPFEKDVEVDPSIARRTSSRFMSLLSRNKQPTLVIKTNAANNEQKERFDVLPSVVVGKVPYLHSMALYRHYLACVLLRDRDNLQSTEPVFEPFLAHFPQLLEMPDLTDLLLERWDLKLKSKSRTDRFTLLAKNAPSRDVEVLVNTLVSTFTEWIYPLMHAHLPTYKAGYPNSIKKRAELISAFKIKGEQKNTGLAAMLDPSIEYEPFDMKELSFSVNGPQCIAAV